MEAENEEALQMPVTPRSAARKSRFGAGNDGQTGSMLSPDVYLWRGDSEQRAKFREMLRERCASYDDGDIMGKGAGEECEEAGVAEDSF